MRSRRTIGVVIGRGPPAVVAEALRAAVGLTLRGDRVALVIDGAALAAAGVEGARAAATLRLFEHGVRVVEDGDGAGGAGSDPVARDELVTADVLELWAGPTARGLALGADGRAWLHLVRPGRSGPAAAATDGGRVLHLPSPADAPPSPAHDLAPDDDLHDQLLDAILAADGVVVW